MRQNTKKNAALRDLLKEKGVSPCQSCGRVLDMGDIAWNNCCTEVGTGFCTIDVICLRCDTEAAYIESWYPYIEDIDDILYVIKTDLE